MTLTKGGSATVDLAQLSVASKDQYGAPFPLSASTWVPSGTGLSFAGTVLNVTAAGTSSLALTSGSVKSNSLPVKATLVNRVLKFNTTGGVVLAPQTVADGTVVDAGKMGLRLSA